MTLFDKSLGAILLEVSITGPTGSRTAFLILDTGAASTVVRNSLLRKVGYDPDSLPQTVTLMTGSGTAAASRITIDKIEALGQERQNFEIVAHTMPPEARIDGVLGLDFFEECVLTLDFKKGEITLTD